MALPWNIINKNVLNINRILEDLMNSTEEKDISWVYRGTDGTVTTMTVPNMAKRISEINAEITEYVDSLSTGSGTEVSTTPPSVGIMDKSTFDKITDMKMNVFAGSGWVTNNDTLGTVDSSGNMESRTLTVGDGAGVNNIRLVSGSGGTSPHIVNVGGITHLVNDTEIKLNSVNTVAGGPTSYQDFVFLESWVEDVTVLDIVYPYGNVQYTGSDIEGLSGIVDGTFTGADTYSLHGNWQTAGSLVGKGYKWSELDDTQKITFASNSDHNMYMDGEKWMQARYRIRVVQGISDGWNYYQYLALDVSGDHAIFNTDMSHQLRLQGKDTTVVDLGDNNGQLAYITNNKGNTVGSYGSSVVQAIPIALIQRRNSGVFDHYVNPFGCAKANVSGRSKAWNLVADGYFASTEDCFDPTKITVFNPDTYEDATLEEFNNGTVTGNYHITGTLATDYETGRYDGLYSDAVDDRDVRDLRMSAINKELQEVYTETKNKLKNNEYRISEFLNRLVTCRKYGLVDTLTDDSSTTSPAVLLDNGVYKMWYTHNVDNENVIYYATSTDGSVWTENGLVLSKGTSGDTDDAAVSAPTVIKDVDTYKMWYGGSDGSTIRMHYATSTDGIVWTKQGIAIPLEDTSLMMLQATSVILDGATYKMWYSGFNSSEEIVIGYTVSTDGITWTNHTAINMTGDTNYSEDYKAQLCVIKDDDKYRMWYDGFSENNETIHYATSDDGITWKPHGNIMPVTFTSKVSENYAPIVLLDNGQYRMWYYSQHYNDGIANQRIHYAELYNIKTFDNGNIELDNDGNDGDIFYRRMATLYTNTNKVSITFVNKYHKYGNGINVIPVDADGVNLKIPTAVIDVTEVLVTKQDGALTVPSFYLDRETNTLEINSTSGVLGYDDDEDMYANIFIKVTANVPTKSVNNLFSDTDDFIMYLDKDVTISGDLKFKNVLSPIINKPMTDLYNEYTVKTAAIDTRANEVHLHSPRDAVVRHNKIEVPSILTENDNSFLLKTYGYLINNSNVLNMALIYDEIPYYTAPMADMSGYTAVGPLFGHDDLGEPVGPTLYKYGVVIDVGANGDTDDYHTAGSTVLLDGTTYKMWYAGNDGSNERIHYATSEDGITWTKHGVVVDLGADGDTDDYRIFSPTVILDGTTYKMWYGGYDRSHIRIHYATSTDGIVWDKYGVVVPLGVDGSTDDNHTYYPTVLLDGTTYKMWYGGNDGSHIRIHYATSEDGIVWDKHGVVVPLGAVGDTDDYHTSSSTVLLDGITYKMWYSGNDGSRARIHYATSEDGIVWDKHGVVVPLGVDGSTDDNHTYYPTVLLDGTTYKMWYGGNDGSHIRIHYATTEYVDPNATPSGFIDDGELNVINDDDYYVTIFNTYVSKSENNSDVNSGSLRLETPYFNK